MSIESKNAEERNWFRIPNETLCLRKTTFFVYRNARRRVSCLAQLGKSPIEDTMSKTYNFISLLFKNGKKDLGPNFVMTYNGTS
jgi:hypothetical protein